MGDGSILLIGPISRTEDLSPHGASENVFWPLVVHSQTRLVGSVGGAADWVGAAASVGAGVDTGAGAAGTALGNATAWGAGNTCGSGDI